MGGEKIKISSFKELLSLNANDYTFVLLHLQMQKFIFGTYTEIGI